MSLQVNACGDFLIIPLRMNMITTENDKSKMIEEE